MPYSSLIGATPLTLVLDMVSGAPGVADDGPSSFTLFMAGSASVPLFSARAPRASSSWGRFNASCVSIVVSPAWVLVRSGQRKLWGSIAIVAGFRIGLISLQALPLLIIPTQRSVLFFSEPKLKARVLPPPDCNTIWPHSGVLRGIGMALVGSMSLSTAAHSTAHTAHARPSLVRSCLEAWPWDVRICRSEIR